LLRRRTASQAEDDRPDEAGNGQVGGADAVDPRRPTGKGRPTPKRREAQKRRTGPVAPPPRTRREAYRRMKDQSAIRRVEAREGMRAGDEKYLLARDRGPVRGFVRDIVDARRNASSLFLVAAVAAAVGLLVPNVQLRAYTMSLWMAVFALVVIEAIILGLRIRRQVRERFPDTKERTGRLVWYAVTRATMIRRLRTPKPRVKVGDKV
jgi:hypothetical protein